ncbi:hypothetical protein [Pseudonocardia sp.]
MSAPELTMVARNATLPDLVEVLRTQHAAKLDVVIHHLVGNVVDSGVES